jgi:lipopolysaccharide biosynthesis glycosyltransferase
VNKLFNKLSTKPIWYIERELIYKYDLCKTEKKLNQLKPINRGGEGKNVLTCITIERDYEIALWTIYSWLNLVDDFKVTLFFDGEIPKKCLNTAKTILPLIEITTVDEFLKKEKLPSFIPETFLKNSPCGRKFAIINIFQNKYPLIYTDHDILVYNYPSEIINNLSTNRCSITIEEDIVYDDVIIEYADNRKLKYTPGFNSGLIGMPQNTLDEKLASELLKFWNSKQTINWFTEQTIHNILLKSANATILPQCKYIISKDRMFYHEKDISYEEIVLRHFVNPVRHVMKLSGIPELLKHKIFVN